MRMRSTRTSCVLSAIAAVALGLGLWTSTASAVGHLKTGNHVQAGQHASADSHVRGGAADSQGMTGGCAGACFSLYSRQLGASGTMNAHIPGDTGTGGKVGRKINLHLAGNFRPNGTFTPTLVGQVAQFCGVNGKDLFAPTSYACLNYSNFWVFEAQWSPLDNQSGLCAGVAVAGQSGESVTLQRCGSSARTLWIGDRVNGRGGDCRFPGNYCPWVNGSDGSSRQPLALTVDTGTPAPANQLRLEPLLLTGSTASGTQEFAYFWGPVS